MWGEPSEMRIEAEEGTRVILVRHGRTAWNDEGRLMGRADIPLDTVGLGQAEGLVDRVRALAPAAIIASPLTRTMATAQPLADALGLVIETDSRWVEVDVGALEGLTWAAVEADFPDFHARMHRDPGGTSRPFGESDIEVRDRAVAAFADCMARHPGESVVVVSHGGTIRAVLAWALGVPLGEKWRLIVDNASMSAIEMTRRGLVVRFVNHSERYFRAGNG